MSDPLEQNMKDRSRTNYNRLKRERPDLFRQAVAIGSLVTCMPSDAEPTAVAAKVESAVVGLVLSLLESPDAV